jgi:hypothetical protein
MLPKQSKIDLRYFTPMAHPTLTGMETLRNAGALRREATHSEFENIGGVLSVILVAVDGAAE